MTTPNNPRHDQALLLYQSLGPKRTFKTVAQQLGVSERTVRSWAKQHDWRGQVAEREMAEARRLADQTLSAAATRRDRNFKIVEMALYKLAKGLADGKVRLQVADIERLIRLQADLDRPDLPGQKGKTPEEIVAGFFSWWRTLDAETRRRTIDQVVRLEQTVPDRCRIDETVMGREHRGRDTAPTTSAQESGEGSPDG